MTRLFAEELCLLIFFSASFSLLSGGYQHHLNDSVYRMVTGLDTVKCIIITKHFTSIPSGSKGYTRKIKIDTDRSRYRSSKSQQWNDCELINIGPKLKSMNTNRQKSATVERTGGQSLPKISMRIGTYDT